MVNSKPPRGLQLNLSEANNGAQAARVTGELGLVYRENAQRLSKAYRDRPAAPLETAVWWTEYIARGNGAPYFRSDGMDMSWYQSYLIDVALVLIISFGVLIYILFRLTKLLLSLLKETPGSQVEKKKKKEN
ncbi:hypothetical protein P5V15_007985 [Pogonomyrmex californicus]